MLLSLKNRFLFIILYNVICVVHLAFGTEFLRCGNETAPINLNIRNCNKLPCLFVRGESAIMLMDFEIDHDVAELSPNVLAHIPGSVMPYPIPQSNACFGLINGECPLDDGEEVTYKLQLPVLESFPLIKVQIQFSLKDENKDVIVCFKISAQVVKK